MRIVLSILALGLGLATTAPAAGVATHVVVVVWDGMRPDFITPTNAPVLHDLAQRGVFFAHNHSVYVTSTEVNGTALATGVYPQTSGVIANSELWPELSPERLIGTDSLNAMRAADRIGRYLNAPTLAEIVQANHLTTAVAGSKPVVLLQDRSERAVAAPNAVLEEGNMLPPGQSAAVTKLLGPFPPIGEANKTNRDLWTARALIGPLWERGVPAFSLLWLAEPDFSQHAAAPGSPHALAAILNSDHALGLVIDALKRKGVYEQTDLFVVSDHGFSTITATINVAARLQQKGFRAARQFSSQTQRGDVLVDGLGGSVFLYVAGHDEATIQRLVGCLQTEDYPGVIFTAKPLPGTFALRDALIGSPHEPDIAIAMRWTDHASPNGTPGELISDNASASDTLVADPQPHTGTHASLSRYDLHNTLVGAGPDLRAGFTDPVPSGNVDVAPTILYLLGVPPPKPMQGRVLFEALTTGKNAPPNAVTHKLETSAPVGGGHWRQSLSVSEVAGVRYFEEGNGRFDGGN